MAAEGFDLCSERDLGWLREDPLAELNVLKMARLSSGAPLVDLSMINPDAAPPRFLLDKLLEATVKPQNHRYAVSRGVRKLREAFSYKYRARFGVSLDPESQVCVTLGTKDALVSTLRVLGKPGDRVAVAEPTYPAHISAIQLAGLVPAFFDLGSNGDELRENLERLLTAGTASIVLLNLPNNPTGLSVSPAEMAAIVRTAGRCGAVLLNDFVYGEMVFAGEPAPSVLSAGVTGAPVLETYSLSKAYSVPGWRVGALAGPAAVVRQVARLKSHSDYGVFLPLQIAAAAGLGAREDLARPVTDQYYQRSRVLREGLGRIGWDVCAPAAGASVWARIPERAAALGSTGVVERMIDRAGVFALPGRVFGPRWDNFVRFALVQGEERLRGAIAGMEQAL